MLHAPIVGRRILVSNLSAVDLPAPLGPMPERFAWLHVEGDILQRPELLVHELVRLGPALERNLYK